MKAKVIRFAFGLIALAIFLVGPVISLSGCALFKRAERPASFAAALATCEAASPPGPEGWKTYVPCCHAAADAHKWPRSECATPDGGAQ